MNGCTSSHWQGADAGLQKMYHLEYQVSIIQMMVIVHVIKLS